MAAFHFNCSGPGAVLIDQTGTRIHSGAEFFSRAGRVAREVLSLDPAIDPRCWHVTVQDGEGFQVEAYRFDDVLPRALHASSERRSKGMTTPPSAGSGSMDLTMA